MTVLGLLRFVVSACLALAAVRWAAARWPKRRLSSEARTSKRRKAEIGHSFRTLILFSTFSFTNYTLYQNYGLTQLYDDFTVYGFGYAILSLIGLIIAQDAYFYWTHRLLHWGYFVRFHSTHHRSPHPSAWTSYSFDFGEAVVQAFYLVAIVWIVPLHIYTLVAFMSIQTLFNIFGHLGFEPLPQAWLQYPVLGWKTTPTHHFLHHAGGVHNYGLYFHFWDRLMGTEHPGYQQAFSDATAPVQAPLFDETVVIG